MTFWFGVLVRRQRFRFEAVDTVLATLTRGCQHCCEFYETHLLVSLSGFAVLLVTVVQFNQ